MSSYNRQKTQDELSREPTPFFDRSAHKRQSREQTPATIYENALQPVHPIPLPGPDPEEVQNILYPKHDAPTSSNDPDDVFDFEPAEIQKFEPQTSFPDYWDLPDQQSFEPWRAKIIKKRKKTTRIGRSMYHALDKHKQFGLIDTGFTDQQGYQNIILHTPKTSKGMPVLFEGKTLEISSCLVSDVQGTIRIGFVTPHKYFRPGNKITSSIIGVSKQEWDKFVDLSQ